MSETNSRADTWTLTIRCPTGSAPARLVLVQKYVAQLGLIVVGVTKPHRTAQDARSGHETSPRSADTMKRNSVAPMAAGDDPSDSPPDPDPEWIANELREQSRREY